VISSFDPTGRPRAPGAYGVALVLTLCANLPLGKFWIEQRVALTDQIWGRCDVAHWDETGPCLTIVDYKNGMRAVDVEENSQLRIYAAASMFTHKLPVKWIRYVVVQPNDWRPFVPRVKQWHEPVESLYDWAARWPQFPRAEVVRCRRPLPRLPAVRQVRRQPRHAREYRRGDCRPDRPGQVRPEQVALFMACEKPIEDQFKKFVKHWQKVALKRAPPPDMKIVTTNPHRAWIDVDKAARRSGDRQMRR
jgi:hypothetical protein